MSVCQSGALSRRESDIALSRRDHGHAACRKHGTQADRKRKDQVFLLEMRSEVSACICAPMRGVEDDEKLRLDGGRSARRQRGLLLRRRGSYGNGGSENANDE